MTKDDPRVTSYDDLELEAGRPASSRRSEVRGRRPVAGGHEDIACAEISNILTFAELPDYTIFKFY